MSDSSVGQPPERSLAGERILVTGGAGRLARGLAPVLLESGATLWAPPRQELDLLSASASKEIACFEPSWIIHAAGLTSIEACENNPVAAEASNVTTTARVIEAGADAGCRGIYISTDYVFGASGEAPYRESDIPAPLNVYGESKARGEALALEAGWAVARVSWLYGDGGGFEGFVASWSTDEAIPILDQRGTPTHIGELSVCLGRLVGEAEGVYHLVGREAMTRLEWARRIRHTCGLPVNFTLVAKVSGSDARRPSDSSLVSTRCDFKGL